MPPEPNPRDGRLLPATRWASVAVFCVLVPALVILWGMPGRTAEAWAWTIRPDLTPIFLGAGYGAGAYFFAHTMLGSRFHPSAAGIFGAAFFAALMLLATLLHWDRFNQGDAPLVGAVVFYGWVAVYVVSPFAVFALWWRNRRTDPRAPEPGDPIVPRWVRLAARVVAVGAFVAALVFYLLPATAIDLWAWQLTPLTSRVIGSFTAQVGVGALLLSLDQRWSAWRLIVQTYWVATGLLLIGAARASGDFYADRPLTYLYLGGLIVSALALVWLAVTMERQARGRESAAAPA